MINVNGMVGSISAVARMMNSTADVISAIKNVKQANDKIREAINSKDSKKQNKVQEKDKIVTAKDVMQEMYRDGMNETEIGDRQNIS